MSWLCLQCVVGRKRHKMYYVRVRTETVCPSSDPQPAFAHSSFNRTRHFCAYPGHPAPPATGYLRLLRPSTYWAGSALQQLRTLLDSALQEVCARSLLPAVSFCSTSRARIFLLYS